METGNHALRILVGGVFDRFPGAKLVLGHMGETLPYKLRRFDSRWTVSNRQDRTLEMAPSAYFKRNIWVNTAGVCSDQPMRCAIDALGADRVMFSMDYQFERSEEASEWFANAPICDAERQAIARDNATSLFKFQRT